MMPRLRCYWLLLTMRILWLQSKYLRYRYTVRVLDYYRPGMSLLLWAAALWPALYFVFTLWAGGLP